MIAGELIIGVIFSQLPDTDSLFSLLASGPFTGYNLVGILKESGVL
jgi:hypothetical protein